MYVGAAWAASENLLAIENAADEHHAEDFLRDGVSTANYPPHGLSAGCSTASTADKPSLRQITVALSTSYHDDQR
jgi:hypothetical protein